MESLANDLSAKLDVYEGILAKQDFLAGERISLVDFFVSLNLQPAST
jgi:glutathione S-transferase